MRCNPLLHSGVRYVEYFSIRTGLPVCRFACKPVCMFTGLDACMLAGLLVCRFTPLLVCFFTCKPVCGFACKGESVLLSGWGAGEDCSSFGVSGRGVVSRDVKRSNLPIVKYVSSVLWQYLQPALRLLVFSPAPRVQ